jgi:hypothetical protein
MRAAQAEFAKIEAYYLAAEFRRARANRTCDHLRWLVHYQVDNVSLGELARRELLEDTVSNRSNVWKAIKPLAADLELPLRPSLPRGRRRAAR